MLNQNPNLLWHGEGNMLPTGIRQHGSLGFYPLVGEFLSAGWAEPALATEGHFFLVNATFVPA